MKKVLLSIVSLVALSGCTVPKFVQDIKMNKKNEVVVAEICIDKTIYDKALSEAKTEYIKNNTSTYLNIDKNGKKINEVYEDVPPNQELTTYQLNGRYTNRGKKNAIMSGVYEATLKGTTIDNRYVFKTSVSYSDELTHFTTYNIKNGNSFQNIQFLFQRDFKTYVLNTWNGWENPDYAFNGSDFLFLSTRDKDRTNELVHVDYPKDKTPKVRFKIMDIEDYYKLNKEDKDTIQNNLPSCGS